MIAPKACYSSLAIPMRETCASVTPSVTVLRTNTTLDCSVMNGIGHGKRSCPKADEMLLYSFKWSAVALIQTA